MDRLHDENEFNHRDTLCYVFKEEKILLIRKKRGPRPSHLSENEVFLNGPGGAIEQDETPRECAIRETEEETGIRPANLQKAGVMRYYKNGEPARFIHIYRTDEFSGSLEESDEAKPVWKDIDGFSYENMWPSDGFWMPELIKGNRFRTEVVYENGNFKEQKSNITRNVEFNQ